jgi:hypothetical protein
MQHEIVIQTSRDRIALDIDAADELLARIQHDPGEFHEPAAQALEAALRASGDTEVQWSEAEKSVALRALGAWLDDVGAAAVGNPPLALRMELMHDLGQLPETSDMPPTPQP